MPPIFNEAELRQNLESQETEELQERIARGMIPEAEELARQILSKRGASPTAPASQLPSGESGSNEWTPALRAEELRLAKKLWRSILVWVCQFSLFFVPSAFVYLLALGHSSKKTLPTGEVVLVLAVAYAAYRVGMSITRKIVESDAMRYAEKLRKIWVLLVGAWVTCFVLFGLAHVLSR